MSNKPEVTGKETVTLDQSGAVMTIDQDGWSMPADYSFDCVNDYVHSVDRHFEELQWLALGMANEIEKLRKDAERIDWLADPNNSIGNVQLPTEIVTQNLHSLRDAIDEAMREVQA